MLKPEEYGAWAKETCVQVFRDAGVVLSEDDSVVLVAAVFRRALDVWLVENKAALDQHTSLLQSSGAALDQLARKAIAEEFGAQAKVLRKDLLEDAASASYEAKTAVEKAFTLPERKNVWRARVQGAFGGAALVILGAALNYWLGH